MGIVSVIRFLKNYVEFEGEGGFSERFINLCSMNNIFVWDIAFTNNRLKAKVRASDYIKLRKIARRSGVKLFLTEKHGLYFNLKKHNERVGLLIGAAIFTVFFSFMSSFIWSVEVSGNLTVPKENVIDMAEELGLFVGTYKPFFNETKAANTLAKNSDDILSWAAINIKGSKAVIEVREQKKSIKEEKDKTPCNLVADFDGTLISVDVFGGIGMVRAGTGVKKGDLLISGVFENDDKSVSFISAEGKISALHTKTESISFNKTTSVANYINSSKHKTLFIFGIDIPLGLNLSAKNCDKFYDDHYLQYNGVRLPIGLKTTLNIKGEKKQRNEKQVFLSSCEKFSNLLYNDNKNTNILKETIKITNTENSYVFSADIKCIDFIGEKQIIRINNENN